MIEILKQIVARTREVRPLIHTITNNVTVNDCANIILAAYGAPTMAQDEREVEEITALSQALVLNLGALRAQEAMLMAGKKANALGHPVVMDPVAAGASFLRGETSRRPAARSADGGHPRQCVRNPGARRGQRDDAGRGGQRG